MRRRYVQVNGELIDVSDYAPEPVAAHVIGDIEPFKSPDGTFITGRAHWREHLKRTDSVEMSHSDIKSAQANWNKRQEQFRDRLRKSAETVKEHSGPVGEVREVRRSNLNVEIANRLHGRPMPERKELIKLTLDIAKRNARGR